MLKEYQKIELPFKFDGVNKTYTSVFLNPVVEYLKTLPWIATEKYDGMNIRVYYDGYRVSYYGRTKNADLPKNVSKLLEDTFSNSEVIFEQNFGNKEVILFMECYGGSVQGSEGRKWYNGVKESLMGFDVMVNEKYLDRIKIKPIFDLFNVPSVELNTYPSLDEIMNEVKEKTIHQDRYFEGYVATPLHPIYNDNGERIIVKVKCDMFRKMLGLNKGENKTKIEKTTKEKPEKPTKLILDLDKLMNLYKDQKNVSISLVLEKGSFNLDINVLKECLVEPKDLTLFDKIKVGTICLIKNKEKTYAFKISNIGATYLSLDLLNKAK